MDIAAAFVVVTCSVSLGLYAVAWSLVFAWAHRQRRLPRPHVASGVTILKPLCGADDELVDNLASFFALRHEPLQLVFGAADPHDPAIALVRRLSRLHPHRDVTIVVGADGDATSPKMAVMEALLPHARHDILLLSDSNVRVSSDEIGHVLPDFADEHVGMVYQPVVGIGERTAAAALENLHYTEFAGCLSIAAAVLAGQHAVNAKGQWVRRAALEDVGGFAQVRDSAADDYMLSRLVVSAGWTLRMAPLPVRIVHRDWSWQGLVQRHLRHAGLRRRVCPWAYPLELLLNPLPWTLLLATVGWGRFVLPLIILKVALEISAARLLRGIPLAWRHAALIPLKDAVYFTGWFASFAVRTVTWRGRSYTIGPQARLVPVSLPDEPLRKGSLRPEADLDQTTGLSGAAGLPRAA